jgi:peptidoglycan hydrolase-like protein with peptidoglycan-binding domain
VSRRLAVPLAAVSVVALAAGATWAVAGGGSGSEANASSTAATRATATVTRRDLVQRETVQGTLGYADKRTLSAQGTGTVTALPSEGTVVRRGQALYWVDGRPVTLMYGWMPFYRHLDPSSANGEDIRQLERNLVELGYDSSGDIEVDDDWDSATTAAVKRWQEDKGLAETGRIDPGQIVFLPGPRRIGQLKTTVGATLQPGAGELMDTTSTRRVVTVDLEADKQSLVKKGDKVIVDLPSGGSVTGRITKVGKVAESTQDPETGEQGEPTIEVEIRLARGTKAGDLDEAPVDVSLAKETAKGALTVPVSALLALAEGGYAVEVVKADGTTQLFAVEPGLFADSFVAITGRGIKPGMKVVVPE